MAQNNPRMNVVVQQDVMIIELMSQKILDEMVISEIGEQLYSLVEKSDYPRMIVDFSSVSHMSSSALGMLITLQKRIKEKDGILKLCCVQPAIYEVFVITRLNEIFDICGSLEEALKGM
ncbi:MAG: STAS domain-containing protein [Phycisphaerae bacterium]